MTTETKDVPAVEFSSIYKEAPDASQLTAGLTLVKFTRKKVAQDQSYRACIVPAFVTAFSATESKTNEAGEREDFDADAPFTVALREAIEQAASDLFRSYCDTNPSAVVVPHALFSISSIAEFLAATQSGQRLNGEEIKAWYLQSDTIKEAVQRYTDSEEGKKKQARLQNAFISLASNNPGITVKNATAMMGYISEKDTEHPVCKAVGKRLEKLMKQDTAEDL